VNTLPDSPRPIVAGLRELADFFEQHPEVPAPVYAQLDLSVRHSETKADDDTGPAEVERIAGILGVNVVTRHGHYLADRRFGGPDAADGVTLHVIYISQAAMDAHHARHAGCAAPTAAQSEGGDR
jgi:hypothetical protein